VSRRVRFSARGCRGGRGMEEEGNKEGAERGRALKRTLRGDVAGQGEPE
jgi:hypothetical protein